MNLQEEEVQCLSEGGAWNIPRVETTTSLPMNPPQHSAFYEGETFAHTLELIASFWNHEPTAANLVDLCDRIDNASCCDGSGMLF